MNFWNAFDSLFSNFGNLTWQMVVMWGIGALLIYLAIAKKMEPSLLLPMGFGAVLVNLPLSGAITQGDTEGPISALFEAGMSNELFPLLLFIGIGAMIDFGPLLEKPWLMLFGAAAQFGIFFTLFLAGFFFDLKDAASIAVIGAADGPTAIFVANTLGSRYLGAIMVAAYSYMAMVPIVQPPVIRLLTTRKERSIRMPYEKSSVSRLTRILFPVVVTVIAGMVAPASVALVGFLMFGNLLRECGVLNTLSETAQNVLANLITLVLGLTVAGQMTADKFVQPDTLLILALGLVAFVFDTVGGVLFAVFTCVCYVTGVAEFAFDDTLKEVCMVMFFTSVGFQANLKVLKSGGRAMIVFLGVVIVLIVSQNFLAVGLANLLDVDPLVGLCTGSIPMVGGHGTAGAFGPVLEDFGIKGATTLCTAATTYGLIAGSMMGGPLGKMLIERHHLLDTIVPEDDSLLVEEEIKHERHSSMYPAASFQLIIAMGIGTVLSRLLSLTGMTFPIYIGAMIAAAIIRNVGEYGGGYTVYMGEINDIGGICLSLFLGMAMITLKLWQLAELALPLIVLLAGQTLFMILYVVLVVFNIMGRDYDAAVIVSGTCGFGMGATPNAMANMQAICDKYSPSVKAYLLIPLVGSLFADFLNSLVITVFINFI